MTRGGDCLCLLSLSVLPALHNAGLPQQAGAVCVLDVERVNVRLIDVCTRVFSEIFFFFLQRGLLNANISLLCMA